MSRNSAIDVELNDRVLGLYWNGRSQLRTAAAFVAAVARSLEGKPAARIGLREMKIVDRGRAAEIAALGDLTENDIDAFEDRHVQDGLLLIDGNLSPYRVKADGSSSGLISLEVPPERHAEFWAAVDAAVDAFHTRGALFRCPWKEKPCARD